MDHYGKKILVWKHSRHTYSDILFSVHHSSPHSLTHDASLCPFRFSTCSFTVLLAVTISSTSHPPKNRSTRK
ncbi:hypothetical protein BT69DRAFT_1287052, partial [Atractiella rhizophila]